MPRHGAQAGTRPGDRAAWRCAGCTARGFCISLSSWAISSRSASMLMPDVRDRGTARRGLARWPCRRSCGRTARQVVLAVGVLDVAEQVGALAGQVVAAAQQIAGGAHLGGIDVGHGEACRRAAGRRSCGSRSCRSWPSRRGWPSCIVRDRGRRGCPARRRDRRASTR